MKTLEAKSLLTGRIHRITLAEAKAFYEEHVLGAVQRFGALALPEVRRRPFGGLFDPIAFVGTLFIELFEPGGDLIDARVATNLVVNAGKDFVIDRLQSLTGTPALMDFMAIGTGTTAAAAGNTTLETEVGTRVQGALTQPTSVTDRLISTFAAGNGTAAITEAGRLNALTVGTLLCRSVFSAINKGVNDSLQVTYDLTIA